jgi:hypothetical protein
MAAVSVVLAVVLPDAVTLLAAVAGPMALVWRQTAPLAAQTGAGLAIVATAAAGSPIDFLAWPAWFALLSHPRPLLPPRVAGRPSRQSAC